MHSGKEEEFLGKIEWDEAMKSCHGHSDCSANCGFPWCDSLYRNSFRQNTSKDIFLAHSKNIRMFNWVYWVLAVGSGGGLSGRKNALLKSGAVEMVCSLRAHTTFCRGASGPNTHIKWFATTCNSASRWSSALFRPHRHLHSYAHTPPPFFHWSPS